MKPLYVEHLDAACNAAYVGFSFLYLLLTTLHLWCSIAILVVALIGFFVYVVFLSPFTNSPLNSLSCRYWTCLHHFSDVFSHACPSLRLSALCRSKPLLTTKPPMLNRPSPTMWRVSDRHHISMVSFFDGVWGPLLSNLLVKR